jgi:small subunit ribosomal protein S8
MTMTDPIADMLTRLRNANSAFHDSVSMPHSKLKGHIAEILQQQGYISGFQITDTEGDLPGRVLTLDLKYGPNRERSIAGVRRVSKPGLRVYAKSTGSSSSGLLTDRQAAKRGVGGEVLAYVW